MHYEMVTKRNEVLAVACPCWLERINGQNPERKKRDPHRMRPNPDHEKDALCACKGFGIKPEFQDRYARHELINAWDQFVHFLQPKVRGYEHFGFGEHICFKNLPPRREDFDQYPPGYCLRCHGGGCIYPSALDEPIDCDVCKGLGAGPGKTHAYVYPDPYHRDPPDPAGTYRMMCGAYVGNVEDTRIYRVRWGARAI